MHRKITASFLALLFVFNVNAETVTISANDGFQLKADYIAATSPLNGAVLMLHQCNADKSMYRDLALSLAKKGISSLALDFRSYGESVTEKVSRKNIRANASSREDYVKQIRAIRKLWPNDVTAALEFLRNKVGDKDISYIGASCGGGQAVTLAQSHKPASFVIFSSGMDEEMIKLFNQVSDVPALIIAAQQDDYTFKSSNKIFKQAKSQQTRLLSYKGEGHGHPLFKQDPKLEETMVEWFGQFAK